MHITDRILHSAFTKILNQTKTPCIASPQVVKQVHIVSNDCRDRFITSKENRAPPLKVKGYLRSAQLTSFNITFKLQNQSYRDQVPNRERSVSNRVGGGSMWRGETQGGFVPVSDRDKPPLHIHPVVVYVKAVNNHDIAHLVRELSRSRVMAVHGNAAQRAREGDHCERVADEFNIPKGSESWNALTMAAVEGIAGQQVYEGKNCREIAVKQGIPRPGGYAWKALMMVAADGKAGERVSNGEDPDKVAHQHGITRGSRAWRSLQRLAEERRNSRPQ